MAEHPGGETPTPPAESPWWRTLLRIVLGNILWCLAPILIVLAAMVIISLLAGEAEVPFIYR